MLGIFKGRSKDKAIVVDNKKNGQTKAESKNALKKCKSQEKPEKENKEKFSRFSFRRSKSLDKKRTKESASHATLFMVSSTPSLLHEKDVANETPREDALAEDSCREDESESLSTNTVSSSDTTAASEGMTPSDSLATSPLVSSSANNNSISSSSLTTSSSLVSEKYLQNCKTYPRKFSVYERPSKTIPSQTSVLSNHSCSTPAMLSSVVRDAAASLTDSSCKFLPSSASEGSASMLSTPSSSTSSLSSVTGRPISPSGRRTPPGPKLGTGGRIPSSPTTIRKTVRTNIKTNPTASGRKVGPLLSLSTSSMEEKGSNPIFEKCENKTVNSSEPCPDILMPILVISQIPDTGGPPNQENLQSPPQSPSPSIGRTRLSVSSMQSLESIPENENDLSAASNDQINSTSRKLSSRKLPPKVNTNINDLKPRSQVLGLHAQESDQINSNKTSVAENIVVPVSKVNDQNDATINETRENRPSSKDFNCNQNETLLTKKPPLVSKRHKDVSRPPVLKEIKDKPKLKLCIAKEPFKETNLNEEITSNTTESQDKDNLITKLDNHSKEMVTNSIKATKLNQHQLIRKEDNTLKNGYVVENNASATHVIFRIPFNSPTQIGKPMKRATSLEILPSSRAKLTSTDEIFPKSSSPVRAIKRRRRSISLPKFLPLKGETDAKFEIPITLNELRNQAEILAKSMEIKDQSLAGRNRSPPKYANPSSKSPKLERDEYITHKIGNVTSGSNQQRQSDLNQISSLNQTESNSSISDVSNPCPERYEDQSACKEKFFLPSQNQNESASEEEIENRKEEEDEEIEFPSKELCEKEISEEEELKDENNTYGSDSGEENPETNNSNLGSKEKRGSVSDHLETDSTLENSDSQKIVQEAITFQIDNENRQSKSMVQTKDKNLQLKKISDNNVEGREIKGGCKIYEEIKALVNRSIQTEDIDLVVHDSTSAINKDELANQENKYQSQIDDLTLKLAEKQQEVTTLVAKLSESGDPNPKRGSHEEELEIEIEDMKKQVKLKENMAESIKVDLQYAKNENTIAKMKLQKLEEDLSQAKESIHSLQEQNSSKTRDCSRLKEVEARVKCLEEELRKSESVRKDLQDSLNDIEAEREEELKIVQDALDEAAQEREELITTFEKELKHLNSTNTAREQQMLEDFEWKLREMEKDHKTKLEEKERQLENTLQRVKCHADDEEIRQRVEKMRNEINAKWEDKLRSECSRLKSELDELHSEEKHLAVESMKVQKEQEMQTLKKSWERTQEEMTKEISTLKDSLTNKDAYYHKEMDSQRTIADRDIWDLRMKLQKLNESSYDKQQQMEEKHREDMERFRVDYEDRIRALESRIATCDAQVGIDVVGQLEKEHKKQMQHLEEQHKLSMERLREELESDKFQAVEEARVIISKNHEYVESNLKDQINDYVSTIAQCREELDSLRASLSRKDESLRSLRDQIERGHEPRTPSSDPLSPYAPGSNPGLSSSQFSLASSTDSQGSRGSQDRFYLPENTGVVEGPDEGVNGQRASTPGILGKVFGVGWFGPQKGKEGGRRGSTPLSSKKTYGS